MGKASDDVSDSFVGSPSGRGATGDALINKKPTWNCIAHVAFVFNVNTLVLFYIGRIVYE